MGIAMAVDDHITLGVARGRDGRVGEQEHASGTCLARFQRCDGDLPAAGAGRRIADDDVPCSAHQGPR